MKVSMSAAFVAALAATEVAAGAISHNHAAHHASLMKSHMEKRSALQKRSFMSDAASSLLTSLGAQLGLNNVANDGTNPWIGADGPVTNTFINNGTEELTVINWGSWGSWINAVKPAITYSLAPGENVTVSYPTGAVGAWAPFSTNSKMIDGQVAEPWGEYSFTGQYATYDISREPNMGSSRQMEIRGPKCTANMNQCAFTCDSGNRCEFGYSLINCLPNPSNPGAGTGTYGGAASGGCGGLGQTGSLTTYLS